MGQYGKKKDCQGNVGSSDKNNEYKQREDGRKNFMRNYKQVFFVVIAAVFNGLMILVLIKKLVDGLGISTVTIIEKNVKQMINIGKKTANQSGK